MTKKKQKTLVFREIALIAIVSGTYKIVEPLYKGIPGHIQTDVSIYNGF